MEEMPRMRSPNLETMVDFQKMVFIYNAIEDGWTVRLMDDGRYEFKKSDKKVTSDQCLDGYLKNFIHYCLSFRPGIGGGEGTAKIDYKSASLKKDN